MEDGLVNKIVRAAIMTGIKPIRRTGLREVIAKSGITSAITQATLIEANERLKRDFGLMFETMTSNSRESMVVPGSSKVKKRREQQEAFQVDITEKQQGFKMGSSNQQSWTVVSILPEKYRIESIFKYSSTSQAQLAGMILALCTLVAVNGGANNIPTSHIDLVSYLEKLGIKKQSKDEVGDILSQPSTRLSCDGLIGYAVRNDYLYKINKGGGQQQQQDNDKSNIGYILGKRAQSELDFNGLRKLLVKVLPKDERIHDKLTNALWDEGR